MKRVGTSTRHGRAVGALLAMTVIAGAASLNGASAARVARSAAPAPMAYVSNTPITDANKCRAITTVGKQPLFDKDAYSLWSHIRDIGADEFYRNGYFGQGVDVAMIDTGVAPVKGFDDKNVMDGPDLSFESQAPYSAIKANKDLTRNDTFGHGTHMAGIIVGHDDPIASTTGGRTPYSWDKSTKFTGVAPGARVISLKVADSVGAVDVTQVIAAIDWVVQHRADPGMNIKVLNLSYGVDSRDSAKKNALAHAVRQAWYAGIVVVAAAGNSGYGGNEFRNMMAPAYDPRIISVGAYDNGGTVGYAYDDTTSDFSSGDQNRHPDLLAPGAHVLSLHVPGSTTDDVVEADCRSSIAEEGSYSSPVFDIDGRFIRGSGTSQSAAMVSGAVALLLSKHTNLTPDQVKDMLVSSTREGVMAQQSVRGSGEIDLSADGAYSRPPRNVNQSTEPSNGGGTLENARGDDALPCLSRDSVEEYEGEWVHTGPRIWDGKYANGLCSDLANLSSRDQKDAIEVDVRGLPFDSAAHACDEEIDPKTGGYYPPSKPCGSSYAAGHVRKRPWRWTAAGEVWNGAVWTGTGMAFTRDANLGRPAWATAAWQGTDWLGRLWRDHDWSGRLWTGRLWRGDAWQESSWLGRLWKGRIWRDHSWADGRWS